MQVYTIVRRETGVWASEFQNAITMIDQTSRSTDRTAQSGSIAVKVTNGNRCEGGWRLTIDGGPEVAYSGVSALLPRVQPGERTIRVVGMVDGVEKRDEKSVAVSSGGSASIESTLA